MAKFSGPGILALLKTKSAAEVASLLGIPTDRLLETVGAAAAIPIPAAKASPRHRAISKALEGIEDHV